MAPSNKGYTCANCGRECPCNTLIPQPDDPSISHIPLSRSRYAIVDAVALDHLQGWIWRVQLSADGQEYAVRAASPHEQGKVVTMHRDLMGLTYGDGKMVDHINGNGLDNRSCNLRIATAAQNNCNRKMHVNNTSGFRGVIRCGERWKAIIAFQKRKYHLGIFSTREEAHHAYVAASIRLHGEFSPELSR